MQKISEIGHEVGLRKILHEARLIPKGFNFLGSPGSCASATYTTCLSFFGGDGAGSSLGDEGMTSSETPTRSSKLYRRHWTNVLIAANVLLVSVFGKYFCSLIGNK